MPNIEIIIPGIIILSTTIIVSKLRKKKKKKEANILIGVAVALLAAFVAIMLMMKGVIKFGEEEKAVSHKNEYLTIAGVELANHLNGKYPSSKIIIIAKKGYLEDPKQQAIISGLKERFSLLANEEDLVVDYLEPTMEGDKAKPLSSTEFNAFLRKHWYGDLYVSIVDLPSDADNMQIWEKEKEKLPIFAVLASKKNPPAEELLNQGLIKAIVFPKKELPDGAPGKDKEQVFKQHFNLIVRPEE